MVHLWYLIHSLTVYVIDNTWSGSKYDFYNNNNVTGAWERVGMEPRWWKTSMETYLVSIFGAWKEFKRMGTTVDIYGKQMKGMVRFGGGMLDVPREY